MQTSVHQGRVFERNENGSSTTETVTGTQAEMQAYLEALVFDSTAGGRHVTSGKVSQVAGTEWKCEVVYADESNGGTVTPPSSAYGKKSATLSTGCMRMPLEKRENYLANWNHYLAKGLLESETDDGLTPDFWFDASTVILSKQDSQRWKWVKSMADIPPDADKLGRTWKIIKDPTKPGVEGYDLATYQVTESVKQPNPTRCGYYVANRLNKIISPNETFGLTVGNWKCDSASIQWDGKHWKATLTYTLSGDAEGWDLDLYELG